MILLAEAQDFDGPQPFVLTEFTKANAWLGTSNSKRENAAGSHWAMLFKATMGFDIDEDGDYDDEALGSAGALKICGGSVDYLELRQAAAGAVLLYADDSKIVIVDVSPEEKTKVIASHVGKKCEIPTHKGFEKYISAPPKSRKSAHALEFSSPWAVLMSSTAALEKSLAKPKLPKLESAEEDIYQIDDNLGGQLVIFRLTKGTYDVHIEKPIEADWGSAQRAVLQRRK